MNASMFSTLLTLAAAPVIDAPLPYSLTARGHRHAAAVRACDAFCRPQALRVPANAPHRPTSFCDTSCVACQLCNVWGELTCSDCAEAKEIANATRIEATLTPCPSLCCHNRLLPGEVCQDCSDFAENA